MRLPDCKQSHARPTCRVAKCACGGVNVGNCEPSGTQAMSAMTAGRCERRLIVAAASARLTGSAKAMISPFT